MPQQRSGTYRRKIILLAQDQLVHAGLEDDYHHFSLCLAHDGEVVTGIDAAHWRTPWNHCAHAGAQLLQLCGRPLLPALGGPDPHQQCTHQYDLALLAMAHALRGGRRVYEAAVDDPVDGERGARLLRDGQAQLQWALRGSTLIRPAPQAGTDLRALDMKALAVRDPEGTEALAVLRRAVMVAGGRAIDQSALRDMRQVATRMTGACYAFQPERIVQGRAMPGSARDFSRVPEQLLRAWPQS